MSDSSAFSQRIPAAAIQGFMRDAFCACGLPADDAAITAAAMLDADLSGSDAHGVFRLPGYVRTLKRGHINVRPDIRIIERGPATALIDGDNGMGHLVMTYAANKAVEIAREAGLGWVGVRRSNHAGAASTYAAIPLAHGMVGIYSAVSGSNFMAPWGGAEPLLGTNPIAVAIPAGKEAPMVLDIATSVASNGSIRAYALEGKPMPEGWVISRADGKPITDGRRLEEGMFVPLGGYKGSGLALVLGLLAGPLNRAAFGRDIRDSNSEQARETNTGQFVIALDVARFLPLDQFGAEVDRHVRDLASSARLPGVDEIRIPGQGRKARREDRQKNGVPLSAALIRQLDELGRSLGISPLTEHG
ncbi:MAG TPA: Ldh family oxidoreductase [Xanthobacteraceae bacterium]|nr:Ldh family oxidoreductase [Xanthobacteraceae bacterium]